MNSHKEYLKLIEKEISTHKFGKSPVSLYEPIRYLMSLGGKRLRPMLTLLSHSLFEANPTPAIKTAVAIEAFHNFTLMHDDIMDKAPLRRGKPTVHVKWNTNTAILSGDVMLVKVYEILSSLESALFKDVITRFNIVAAEVCEGQQWDMEFESYTTVKENEYINMIRLKTAVLLGFSLEAGAILANATDLQRKTLRNCGTLMGIGFQLKDDLLDAYGDPEKFGKQVGGDIIANKKTFLLIKALETGSPKQIKELRSWLEAKKFNKKAKVAAVKAIYDDLRIQEKTTRKINSYFKKSFEALDELQQTGLDTSSLRQFAAALMERQS